MNMKVYTIALILILKFANAQTSTPLTNDQLAQRVEILADEINQLKAYQMSVSKNEGVIGLSPSASKVYHIPRGLSVGGYGEITYLNKDSEKQNGDSTNVDPTSEVLRNIIYLGYKFNDKWLVNMELEIEHVSQVFTEFMYLDYMNSNEFNVRAGLLLHPIGFVNELHEPTVFQGVLRPQVESVIIPTTWRELGLGLYGSSGKSSYKLYVMNGMNAEGFTLASNRGARKRGGHYSSNAEKEDSQRTSTGAIVYRYDYQLNNQLMLGSSGLIGQASGDSEDLNQRMISFHGEYTNRAHKFRFLAVSNYFSNANQWNEQTDVAENSVNKEQRGGYLEYNYSIDNTNGTRIVPFIRHEIIDLQSSRASAVADDGSLERQHTTFGLSFFPHEQIVFKADYTVNKNDNNTGVNILALGMGYNF